MKSHNIYYHLENSFDWSLLRQLPTTARHQPPGSLLFLHEHGVLSKAGKEYQDRAWRVKWGPGPKFAAFMRWCEMRGKL